MATRPSLLNRAELCSLAPVLAEQYPEEVPAGWRGTDVHVEIKRAWETGDEPIIPEAKAAVDWLRELIGNRDCRIGFEVKIVLVNPTTMAVVTEGTADVVLSWPDGSVTVIDWKTGNPEYVREVDDNLQLGAYGLGASQGFAFQTCLVFLDGTDADARWGRIWQPDAHPALLARIEAAASRAPAACLGDWCQECWARTHCPSYQARLATGTALALQPGQPLTDESASKLAEVVKMLDGDKGALAYAKNALKDFVRAGGVVTVNGKVMKLVEQRGRESADMDALRADGMTKYIRRGAPFITTKWVKP